MSDDTSGDFELDLTDYIEPTDLDAAWAFVLAEALREGPEPGAEPEGDEPPEIEDNLRDANEGLPSGFDDWTPHQREHWAWGEDVPRTEQRARRDMLDAWDMLHGPPRRLPTVARSGWTDMPLDGILGQIEAGTLVLPVPRVGMLADASAGLLYPARVNGVAGESGSGKGWLALWIGLEQMMLGFHFYYLDYEDSPALALLRLVRVLGADPSIVRAQFHYLHPSQHDDEGIAALVARVAETPGALVVIDSSGESIASAGWNQNHDEEVARWFQSLAHPLADEGGATVLLLDHMVKSEDGGLWPIGSQRKRAAITGAQYVAEVADPFSESKNGMVVLRVAKDRHGARDARSVASYVQFMHPVESTTTLPDGTVEVVLSKTLELTLGAGKTAAQVKAARAAKASAAVDADVASLDALIPAPTSIKDVRARLQWGTDRASRALAEWRSRQPGGAP